MHEGLELWGYGDYLSIHRWEGTHHFLYLILVVTEELLRSDDDDDDDDDYVNMLPQ
jgi:hypothetical protein